MTERRHRYLLPDRRIDHRISEKNTIFGRWTTNWAHYVTAQNYPSLATTTLRHSHHIVITDTHVFSPTLVNTFRFGFYKEGTCNGARDGAFSLNALARARMLNCVEHRNNIAFFSSRH